MNLGTIFLTGLFTGGLSCLAVQGGLLATTIAQREEDKLKEQTNRTGNAVPILSFLAAKLFAYSILGLLLGWFGSLFQLSLSAMTILQFSAAVFMIGTALNLLNVHPIFRYFVIQPPRFITRIIRKHSKSSDFFAPALLGAFTVFIPCGTTQAMMALAIASGNPFTGAAILFAFTVGTSPVFFILGYLATKLSESLQQKFMKIAAYAILLLALYNLNGALALTGSNITLKNVLSKINCTISFCEKDFSSRTRALMPVTDATITITNEGYSPENLAVKAGSKVTLRLKNEGGGGCTQAVTIPRLKIQKIVPIGTSDTITFTAPNEPGTQLAFMCSMGMFSGTIDII